MNQQVLAAGACAEPDPTSGAANQMAPTFASTPVPRQRSTASRCNTWLWILALMVSLLSTAISVRGGSCDLYPIALSVTTLEGCDPGAILPDILEGAGPGQFGWLTWAGSPNTLTLLRSLTPPGDIVSYVNPDDTRDRVPSIGDWVRGKPGVSNSKQIRDALDLLLHQEIIVPVWDATRGQGDTAAYRIAGFARVELLEYRLSNQSRIQARFLGYATCDVANNPPIVDAGADLSVWAGELVTLRGAATDDGLPPGSKLTFAWSQIDGPALALITDPGEPQTIVQFPIAGIYVLRLSVSDSDLIGTDDVTIAVGQPNRPPIAFPQTVTTLEDHPVDLLLEGHDPDGDKLRFEIVIEPAHGNLSGTPPQLRYTPLPDYHGEDAFTFLVADGELDSEAATIEIRILPVNDPPVADPQTVHTWEDTPVEITLTGADLEGSSLAFRVLYLPEHGTLSGTPPDLIYTPAQDFHGQDQFEFMVDDGELDSLPALIVVHVEPVNDPPVADAGPDLLLNFPTLSVVLHGTVSDDDHTGELAVEWKRVSGPGEVAFESPDQPITRVTFSEAGIHVLELVADDSLLSTYDRVTVFINLPPTVDAGPDRTAALLEGTLLTATVSDDGLPLNAVLEINWTVVSGPGIVWFTDPTATTCPVQFDSPGVYILRLTAHDSQLTGHGDVIVTVLPPNQPPSVYAGPDRLIAFLDQLQIEASIIDDGIPEDGALSCVWSKVDGPGFVTFSPPDDPATVVTFDTPGIYQLRLTATDSELEASHDLLVTVNQPPSVDPGPDLIATVFSPLELRGFVTDDGLPQSLLHVAWSRYAGPGPAYLATPNETRTEVEFHLPGEYTLRLTATDGHLSQSADVVVSVKPAGENQPPRVDAGPDRYIARTDRVTLDGHVIDDGLPHGNPLFIEWTMLDGPGSVQFADPHATNTLATFEHAGSYRLRLSAHDGEFSVHDELQLAIYPDNQPPVVDAGPDQTVLRGPAILSALVSDDGLPDGFGLSLNWSKLNGPGQVWFDPPDHALARVTFSEPGLYLLRLTASDGEFTSRDELTITVTGNQPPVVWAGMDQVLDLFLPEGQAPPAQTLYPQMPDAWHYAVGQPGLSGTWVLGNCLAVSGTDLYVGGNFTYSDDVYLRSMGHWNGCQWAPLYDPRPINPQDPSSPPIGHIAHSGTTSAVGARGSEVFVTGGFLRDLNRDGHLDFTSRWTGSGWEHWQFKIASSYVSGRVMHTTADAVYFGGQFKFQTSNIPEAPISFAIAKWNGQHWERLGEGIRDIRDTPDRTSTQYAVVNALASAPNGDLFAGGRFILQTSSGLTTNLARWDGTQWWPVGQQGTLSGCVGTSCSTEIQALTCDADGVLYVGGNFTVAANQPAHFIALWDGESWSTLGAGFNSPVHALAWRGGNLFAGGSFSQADNQSARFIARWDGTQWHPLGTGLSSRVTSLANSPGGLYIGGLFTFANSQPSALLANWGHDPNPTLTGPDPVTVRQTNDQATLISTSIVAAHPCGLPMTITWNVNGGPVEQIDHILDDTAFNPAQISFNHTYPPGRHTIIASADDGIVPPTLFMTSVTVLAPASTTLMGVVTDDGLPDSGQLTTAWTQIAGPEIATIESPASPTTRVAFSQPGTYSLQLEADDSELAASDNVLIAIRAFGNENLPPIIQASPNQHLLANDSLRLVGTAFDDGLPDGQLALHWTQLAGPAVVTLESVDAANPHLYPLQSADLTATLTVVAPLPVPGDYQFRFHADDTEFVRHHDVSVTVSPQINQAPSVIAGPPQTIALGGEAILFGHAQDDGLPAGLLLTGWSILDGPGESLLQVHDQAVVASFSEPGQYQLRFTANDGRTESHADVAITVLPDTPAPVVTFNNLPDGTIITAPTEIRGSVITSLLDFWRIELRPTPTTLEHPGAGLDSSWTVIASGDRPVTEDTLGLLDPTLLLNGPYQLRLQATDRLGQTTTSDPVDLLFDGQFKPGNQRLAFTDLTLPMAGIPIEIVRVYDSRAALANVHGDFGIGWTLEIRSVRLRKTRHLGLDWQQVALGGWYAFDPGRPREIIITFPDDRLLRFRAELAPALQFGYPIATVTMQFTPMPGTLGQLEIAEPNLASVDGFIGPVNLIDLGTFADFNPTRFRYRSPEGDSYLIDESLGLLSVTDRLGNTLRIDPDGLHHSSGLSVLFERDALSRLSAVIDPIGQGLLYERDPIGNLIAVTDRSGHTTSFHYLHPALAHHLTAILQPGLIPVLRTEYDAKGRMLRQIDPDGNSVEFHPDLAQRHEIIRNRLGHATVFEYDERGNVIRQTDPLGAVTTSDYDPYDNLLLQTDPLGHTRHFTYDQQFNLLSETDPLGHITRYTYNSHRQLTSITDPLGHTLSNRYNPAGLLIESIDPTGARTLFDHNPQGLLTAVTNALGHVTRYQYDPQGRLIQELAPNGRITTFLPDANGLPTQIVTTRSTPFETELLQVDLAYDPAGRLLRVTMPDGTTASQTFSPQGLVVRQVDPLGRVTQFEQDSAGRLVRTLHPDLSCELIAYDPEHRPLSITNALGHVTRFTHDPLGRLTGIIAPDDSQWSGHYDPAGRLVQITDPRGYHTRYEYDAAGHLVAVTNALLEVTRYEYDPAGHLVATLDPLDHSTRYLYDPAGRLSQIAHPDQSTQSFEFDPLGRLCATVDQAGHITRFEYSQHGQLTTVTDPLGQVTRYEYDSCGLLRRQIDVMGHATIYAYDRIGRLTHRTLPGGQFESFTYDDAAQLVAHTDRNGHTTTYHYDPRGRLLQKDPDPAFQTSPVSYTYNALGLRTTMSDPTGITTYQYDPLNRLIEKTVHWAAQLPSSTLHYDYDSIGNVIAIQSAHPNGTDVAYEWDPLNRLSVVRDHGSASVPLETEYAYDPVGNLQAFSAPNGLITTCEHDALRHLTNLVTFHPDRGELSRRAYRRNPTGRRVTTLETVSSQSQPEWVQLDHAYDALHRLTSESWSTAAHQASVHYTYDAAGNRLSRTIDDMGFIGLASASYTYDSNHRYDAHRYDANGNTSEATVHSPNPLSVHDQYDFENHLTRRLTAFEQQPLNIERHHNGDGWPIIQSVGDQTRLYLIDDRNPTGYPQIVEELVVDGASLVTVRSCTYGHAILYQDLLIDSADEQLTWQLRFHGADTLGSTRYLTDLDATLTDTWDYDAFGNIIQRSGQSPNQHLFAGEWFDPHLGLYQLRARDYCPDLGRFWTPDPFAGFLDQPGTRHPYLFALNDPVNRLDPGGHFSSLSMSLGVTYGLSLRTMYDGVVLQVGFGLIQSLESLQQGRTDDQILLDYFLASLIPGASQFALTYGPVAVQLALRNATSRSLASLTRATAPPAPTLQSWQQGTKLEAHALLQGGANNTTARTTARFEWPPNRGFVIGEGGQATVLPGQILNRYGGTGGNFLSPVGTPAAARSLSPGTELRPLNHFEVMKRFEAGAGRAAPWFNQPGGGLQFDLGTSTVQDLIDAGVLRLVP